MPTLAQIARLNRAKKDRRRRGWSRGFALNIPPVTFPSSPLTTRVYIALGADLTASHLTWNWLDITGYVRHDLGISVQSGRRDEFTKVTASRCQLKLENTDGRFSRHKATGPYFGLLTKNTPIWIQTNPGSGLVDRYSGYVNDWPTRWSDESATDSYVVIQCAGVMRRLGQGENVQTPLDRVIDVDNPTHYWRLDDRAGTSLASNAIFGAQKLPASGVNWRAVESPPGGDGEQSAPSMTAGYFQIETLDAPAPWTFEWSVKRPTDGTLDLAALMTMNFYVSGTPTPINVSMLEDTTVSARDWYHYTFVGQQLGADYEVRLWKNGTDRGTVSAGAGTLGNLWYIATVPQAVTAWGFSHWAVYDRANIDASAHSDALQAFDGELAHRRFLRVCAELGITAWSQAADSAAMGPQPSGTGLDVLRDVETTDGGVLYERVYGLGFQALSERYNAPVALELDFDQRHIGGLPEPADDDQRTRNQWTIRRSGGSSATYRDQASVDADGLYDDADTVNVETDAQLIDHAAWRVHVGTVDEDRWPRLPLKLHGTPSLIPGWLATPFGSRVTVANPPPQMAPDTIDAIIEGYTEHWDTVQWNVALNTSPASPYQVGVAGGGSIGGSWAQTSGTELAADITTSATSFNVNITAGPLWTTSPAGQYIVIGGEVMALDGVSGASSPQTFTVTRSVNGVVKAHTITGPAHLRAVKVYRPAIAAL